MHQGCPEQPCYAPIPVANQVLINQATLTVNATISGAVDAANTACGTNAATWM
ncbi:hypothetical protein [Pseudarthrobacter enclensis]|uniref:Uncharacterized protein n=1 Tax=Pseudarthrobacter enclensis TaxID=993070 RepID=A0ABT9RUG0_9MICC|nr:hypothetical protein [Pseudarthrobacter enclensis]MDP9888876.1 hypothetical protein [Pseudarthrobacter enclensis]